MEARRVSTLTPKTPYGVRGWLLVLCIWLTASSALMFLGLAYIGIAIPGASNYSPLMLLAIASIFFGSGFVVGLLLWTRARSAFAAAVTYFVVNLVIWATAALMGSIFKSDGILSCVIIFCFNLVWLMYLLKSDRVTNTYRLPFPRNRCRPTPTSNNYLVRHWRGELGLGVSYWVNSLLLMASVGVIGFALRTMDIVQHPRLWLAASATATVFGIAGSVWLSIGIWRSAWYAKRAFWGIAARVVVTLSLLVLGSRALMYGVPYSAEAYRIAVAGDDTPPHQLRLVRNGQGLEISGGIDFGTAHDVQAVLSAAPGVRTVDLNSIGGWTAEAAKLRDIVQQRHLATYTSDMCASACTMVYLAGQRRYLGPHGRLGFHRSSFAGQSPEQERDNIREQEREMIAAGVTPEFAAKASATAANDLWVPDRVTLVNAHVVTDLLD
jgi:hypothetical protein